MVYKITCQELWILPLLFLLSSPSCLPPPLLPFPPSSLLPPSSLSLLSPFLLSPFLLSSLPLFLFVLLYPSTLLPSPHSFSSLLPPPPPSPPPGECLFPVLQMQSTRQCLPTLLTSGRNGSWRIQEGWRCLWTKTTTRRLQLAWPLTLPPRQMWPLVRSSCKVIHSLQLSISL